MLDRYISLASKPWIEELAAVEQLGDRAVVNEIHADLFRASIQLPNSDGQQHDILSNSYAFAELTAPIRKKIKLAEHFNRLVLLAMAVWKAQCVLCVPTTNSNCYLVAQEWSRSGWKQCKNEHRTSNAIGIILAAVRPFCGKET